MFRRGVPFLIAPVLVLIAAVPVVAATQWKPDGAAVIRFIQQKTLVQADAPNVVEPRPVNRFLALQLKGIREVNNACTGYTNYANVPEPPQYDLSKSAAYAAAALLAVQSIDFNRKFTDSALSVRDRHREHVPSAAIQRDFQVIEQNLYAYQQRLLYTQSLASQGLLTNADIHRRLDAAYILLATPEEITADQDLANWDQQHCAATSGQRTTVTAPQG